MEEKKNLSFRSELKREFLRKMTVWRALLLLIACVCSGWIWVYACKTLPLSMPGIGDSTFAVFLYGFYIYAFVEFTFFLTDTLKIWWRKRKKGNVSE